MLRVVVSLQGDGGEGPSCPTPPLAPRPTAPGLPFQVCILSYSLATLTYASTCYLCRPVFSSSDNLPMCKENNDSLIMWIFGDN